MKLNKDKQGNYLFEALEFSAPFKVYGGKQTNVAIKINLNELVDGYDYHDFPSSETIYVDKEGLLELREIIDKLIGEITNE